MLSVTVPAAVTGTYGITAGGVITNDGALDITGITTMTGTDITLDHASNDFKNAVRVTTTGSDVVLTDLGAIELGASTVTGTYTVNAGGTVTDSGTLTITGTTTINASNHNVELNEAASNFGGAVSIRGKNVEVTDANTIELGTSIVTGTYAVTATAGNITNSGVLTITGAATFTAANGQSIYLDSANIFSNTVTFSSGGTLANVTIKNTATFDLLALTLSGDLIVTSTGGSITDSGALAISGTSAFTTSTSNEDITLDITTNAFTGAVTLSTTGLTGNAEVDGGTTKLNIATSTVGGELKLTSGNAADAFGIIDSGTVTVGGNLIVTNDVSNGDINMGSLAVDGTITLVTSGSGGDVTVVNDAGLNFATSTIGGDLIATATTGNISDYRTLTVTGATNIYLGTNPILSIAGATSATDIWGKTIIFDISVFTGGITLHYENVLPPDNSDIDLARQVTFAELDFAIDQNITKIYGSYEEMQDDILWMYKLFRDSFPEQEQSLEVVRQPQPNQVKIRKIKANTNKNNASEGKEL